LKQDRPPINVHPSMYHQHPIHKPSTTDQYAITITIINNVNNKDNVT
jgi:hypothetical protein